MCVQNCTRYTSYTICVGHESTTRMQSWLSLQMTTHITRAGMSVWNSKSRRWTFMWQDRSICPQTLHEGCPRQLDKGRAETEFNPCRLNKLMAALGSCGFRGWCHSPSSIQNLTGSITTSQDLPALFQAYVDLCVLFKEPEDGVIEAASEWGQVVKPCSEKGSKEGGWNYLPSGSCLSFPALQNCSSSAESRVAGLGKPSLPASILRMCWLLLAK